MTRDRLWKIGPEHFDDASGLGDAVLDLAEFHTPSLAERYANGSGVIHLHLRIAGQGLDLKGEEFCAVYRKAVWNDDPSTRKMPVTMHGQFDASLREIAEKDSTSVERLVLVNVGKGGKPFEQSGTEGIRSVVRLKPTNLCDVAASETSYLAGKRRCLAGLGFE